MRSNKIPTQSPRNAQKLQIHNTLLKPSCAHGIKLCRSTKPSNYRRIQFLQLKAIRKLCYSALYASKSIIDRDLNTPAVRHLTTARYHHFPTEQKGHPNPLVQALHFRTAPTSPRRRLNREWPRDLFLIYPTKQKNPIFFQLISFRPQYLLILPSYTECYGLEAKTCKRTDIITS